MLWYFRGFEDGDLCPKGLGNIFVSNHNLYVFCKVSTYELTLHLSYSSSEARRASWSGLLWSGDWLSGVGLVGQLQAQTVLDKTGFQ